MKSYQIDLVRWKIFGAFTKACMEARKREKMESCKGNRMASMLGFGPNYRYSIELTEVEADEYLQVA